MGVPPIKVAYPQIGEDPIIGWPPNRGSPSYKVAYPNIGASLLLGGPQLRGALYVGLPNDKGSPLILR